MKLRTKQHACSKVTRTYHDARTPIQRLSSSTALPHDIRDQLLALFAALDPVRLLQQLHTLQEALWRHAVVASATGAPHVGHLPDAKEVQFNVRGCGVPIAPEVVSVTGPSIADLAAFLTGSASTKRKYQRVKTEDADGPHLADP